MERKQLMQDFKEQFGHKADRVLFSPGRINLIGEHTDYNGGKVFPCAITMGTYGVVKKREDKEVHAFSGNFPEVGEITFNIQDLSFKKEDNWTNYVKGMIRYMQEKVGELPHGFDLYIYGTIPNGASLSSSASLELLTGVIVRDMYQLDIPQLDLVKLGMRTENEFLGLNSGILDQFAVGMAKKGYAMLLDTNTLEYEQVPVELPDHKIVIMNSMTRRELVDSEYNTRREQCEQALEQLQEVVDVKSLGELSVEAFEEHKHVINDDVLMRRARHAVYENVRTDRAAEALKAGELNTFGQYMNESHKSLDEDYEVTIKATDYLARAAWKEAGVAGARMTGGGFGGCCIAIVENEDVDTFIDHVGRGFKEEIGHDAEFYIAETADGTKEWVAHE
ncbi:galactokinase [Alkalibacterium putridalgicola]|uniref:Galactokinase n=1 Tax=Alkalibacterium putridalgicola TaxID=426703 RepID=A0A1H7UW57_9LACT|nr:galactokinase [Alkalibacterium putridalgicola]GEK89540.1 galactokinase [Alkalibacterium putridalgicola]SEM01202.1 galactokinase [Alkalibacterium putridalgicola]